MTAVTSAVKKLNLKGQAQGQAELDLIKLVSNPKLEKKERKKLLDALIGGAKGR